MFYADAKELGEEFFSPFDQFDSYGRTNQIKHRGEIFAKWVGRILMPEFNDHNPERTLKINERSDLSLICSNRSTDVHRDSLRPGESTFVTLALTANGENASTLFTRDESLERERTGDLDKKFIEANFVTAPDGFVSVFDPDHDLHAARPNNTPEWPDSRIIFRSAFIHKLSPDIITPNSPGYLEPTFPTSK